MRVRIILASILLIFVYSIAIIPITSNANDLTILSHSSYTDSLGYFHVVGEVQNLGSSNHEYVKITCTFYDSTDVVIGTTFTFTDLDVLMPDKKSPFDLFLMDTGQSSMVDHYSLTLTSSVTTSIPEKLRILSHSSYTDSIDYLHVVGEIENNGTITATYVKIIATFYNSTGGVVATSFTFSDPEDIGPGGKAPFDLFIDPDRATSAASYVLTADSQEYALIPEFSHILIIVIIAFSGVTLLTIRQKRIL